MEVLTWLTNWYASQCDGDWEHLYGVKIDTLDNPGWLVKIDLSWTTMEDVYFEKYSYDKGADWLFFEVKDNVFRGAGDETKISEILETFKTWVEQNQM